MLAPPGLEILIYLIFAITTLCLGARVKALRKAILQSKLEQEAQASAITTLTHEMRTPLGGVIGMLKLTSATKCNPEQETYLGHALASAHNLLSILDETLDQAKSEKLQNSEVNLSHLLESVAELLSPRAHAKNTELATYVATDLPERIEVDETKLRQLLYNLAGNAIKFTNIGGVSLSAIRTDQSRIQFQIADTGIGMDEAEKAKLFLSFAQANSTVSRKFGGSGLGLSISQNLTKALGGTLALNSKPDHGTTFTIEIPLIEKTNKKVLEKPLTGRHFKLCLAPGFTQKHLHQTLKDWGAIVTSEPNPKLLFINAPHEQISTTYICGPPAFKKLKSWSKSSKDKHAEIWVVLTPEMRHTEQSLLKAPFAGYLLQPLRRETLLAQLSRKNVNRLQAVARKMRNGTITQKPNILLAEDNQVSALIAVKMVSSLGYCVTHVTNGTDAKTELQRKNKFAFAMLDLDMPGLSGVEVTQAIRLHEKTNSIPKIPIFAFSSTIHHATLQKALRAGMTDIIAKPLDLDDFNRKLSKHNLLSHDEAA